MLLGSFDDDTVSRLTLFSCCGLILVAGLILTVVLPNFAPLFLSSHGWSHRLSGGLLFAWLVLGLYWTVQWNHNRPSWLGYDIVLGSLGSLTTYSASRDFPHKYVRNAPGQSGTLSQRALVTQAEMQEHLFYQLLNLAQALYLHFLATSSSFGRRFVALVAVTAPWMIRHKFPVHSFSQNWKQPNHSKDEETLYKIKKCQYLLYKHVILHGLNLSVALQTARISLLDPTQSQTWRVFWLALNWSYTMEFFLQSLVRRGVLSQTGMLTIQRWLMGSSSLAAGLIVTQYVQPLLCILSLMLNLVHRHHDFINTIGLALFAHGVQILVL